MRPSGRVLQEMLYEYNGPVVASQDLTVFKITKEAVVARVMKADPFLCRCPGSPTKQQPGKANPPAAWWNDALPT